MTRTRLSTGFHRLGIILAIPFGVLAIGALAVTAFERPADPSAPLTYAALFICCGALAYGVCRVLAWIIGGFMGE